MQKIPVTYADSSGLEEDYGFKAKVDIRAGLRKFCEWYEGMDKRHIGLLCVIDFHETLIDI